MSAGKPYLVVVVFRVVVTAVVVVAEVVVVGGSVSVVSTVVSAAVSGVVVVIVIVTVVSTSVSTSLVVFFVVVVFVVGAAVSEADVVVAVVEAAVFSEREEVAVSVVVFEKVVLCGVVTEAVVSVGRAFLPPFASLPLTITPPNIADKARMHHIVTLSGSFPASPFFLPPSFFSDPIPHHFPTYTLCYIGQIIPFLARICQV